MKYTVSKEEGKAYLQLYRQIREDIVNGILPHGSRLPSKRLLAEETGVSVITVQHAYNILADEGYVETRQRSGVFVTYRPKDTFSVASAKRRSEVVLSKGRDEDEAFPFSVFARTMRKVISVYDERIMDRSPEYGTRELRQALAGYLARSRGIYVKPEQIVIGSGSEYMYGIIIQMFGRSRIYGLESPSFEKIEQVYKGNGARIDFLKMGPDGVLTSELERTPASVLHVTPYNSYPTGITASASKRREYVDWALERNAVIIEDDYDSEFSSLTKTEDTLFSLEPEHTVVYVNSFSMSVSPAIRAGYMVLPSALLEQYEKNVGFYSCTVPVFEQFVLAELLNSGDFERHINRVRRIRRQKKKANLVI